MINVSLKRITLVLLALILSVLACARADVPVPGAIGSGELPSATIPQSIPSPVASVTVTVENTVEPTATPFEPEPLVSPTFPPTPTIGATEVVETLLYEAQPGDSPWTVAVRFGVLPEDITSPDPLPGERGLIDPGQFLIIPRRLETTGPNQRLIPDSELVFSPHATDFDASAFATSQGGYLAQYREVVDGIWLSGPEVVAHVARDNSINPRILLALLEYRSGWVTDPEAPYGEAFKYPMGVIDERIPGLQRQLTWLANELGNGYYGWRSGTLTMITLQDGLSVRLAPDLNAGTVALHYYFALYHGAFEWEYDLGADGFIRTFTEFFGDPWAYQHPLYEIGVEQPTMILPFLPGHTWAFTGGPHGAWERESAWAGLDFAPASMESGCVRSDEWVVAAADGYVVRSEKGVVVLDLDGDGREQSGWALLYLHVATKGRVEEGTLLTQGELIGHPSCEGGIATGTHIHLARKYNGEWILADGPLPFEMSGWIPIAGSKPYQGALVKGDQVIYACPCATQETQIRR
jgi:murein DD-endopeptidase MepM/ murein hydrolase activator NlpD